MAEIKCYGIGTGCVNPFYKKSREAVEYIAVLDGFMGVHTLQDGRNLWIFDTLNHAKAARNLMEREGIVCGKEIGEVYVDEQYVGVR